MKNPYSSNKAVRPRMTEDTQQFDEMLRTQLSQIAAQEPRPESKYSGDNTNSALKLINTEKFIQRNNFMPVPPIQPSATMMIQS